LKILGFVIFWDLVKARPLKVINAGDKIQGNSSIVNVQFLHSDNEVVAIDDMV